MEFEFEQPLRLLLIIPALLLVGLFLRTKVQLTKRERNVIVSLRSLIVLLLVFALSLPNLVFSTDNIHTVFIVDRSNSMNNENAEMTAFIREAVTAKHADDSFAIVSVGMDATIERMLSEESNFSSEWSTVNPDYTNLESGLQIAASLLAKEKSGRIVLLSDGNETIGDALQQASIVREHGVTIDVVPIYQASTKDVSLQEFDVPRHMFKGEQASLFLAIDSTEETETTIRILLNNEAIVQEKVQLKQGTNSFHFTYPITKNGMQRFRAEVLTEGDLIPENNQLAALTVVSGTPRVLFVEGDPKKTDRLSEALLSTGVDVKRITANLLPTELNGYLQYESIIFSNVSGTRIADKQMELIEKAVHDFGVGFIMTGGENSFALGGYKDTSIEKVLPVEMEIKSEEELPSLGLVFVIDRSGSMMGNRLELAKEAAARSVELLQIGDTVGVIAFDDQTWQIVDTAAITKIKDVTEKILGITAGGGTNIYPGLADAYDQLTPLELQRKHIILLTDGQSPENGNYQALIEAGKEEDQITLSTVAIGFDADHYLLEQLAEYGAGRFYPVYDETTIPSILARETMLTTRTYIEDQPFYPNVLNTTEWTTHFKSGVPQLNAYIATTPKGRATSILTSEKEDPVLSRWQYGLGKTVAWTSDIEGVWSGQWAAWENWSSLWNDIVAWTFPANIQEPFEIAQKREGTTSILTFTTEDNQSRPLEATIVNEQGQVVDSNIRMTAPGKYEVTFAGQEGMHFVQLTDLQQTPVFQTGITVAYPDEYRMQPTNKEFLVGLANVGEGEALEVAADAFRPLTERPVSRQSLVKWFILLAFLLFFIEVAIRRFGVPRLSRIFSKADQDDRSVVKPIAKIPVINRQVKAKNLQQEERKSVSKFQLSQKELDKAQIVEKDKGKIKLVDSKVSRNNQKSSSQATMQRLLEAKKRGQR